MKVFLGSRGTGKTGKLLEIYHQLIDSGVKSGQILVLVVNASTVSAWRAKLGLTASGNLDIFTYFGLVQREVMRFWPQIDSLLGGSTAVQPTYMTAETAHYLMWLLVEKARKDGYFPEVRATSQQIAVQLLDNLNQVAINGLSLQEAGRRLYKSSGANGAKAQAFAHSSEVMEIFRLNCLRSRCLDYSLTVELFNRYLLTDAAYIQLLRNTWPYLIVDNLEETVPAAQDLILALMETAHEAYLAYDPYGGHSNFFGADPLLAAEQILPRCEIEEMSLDMGKAEAMELAASLERRMLDGNAPGDGSRPTSFIKGQILTRFRGEMLTEVGKEVANLVHSGVEPEQIAIIAPSIDKVLEFSLGKYLGHKGIPVINLSRGKRLLDQPFAQALISLALLVYPQWHLSLNFSGLVQTLSVLLRLDPIRSALLAEEIYKYKLGLPDLDASGLRHRLGFDNSERYEHLQRWIKERQKQEPDLELLFQQVFAELLAPLLPGQTDLLACRQVIDSVSKFNKVIGKYPLDSGVNPGKQFLDMVLRGTLAAETLFKPSENTGKVLLATPYTFLFSPYINGVKYQFWLDTASEQWLRGSTKELTNPHVLSRRWHQDREWDDSVDQHIRTSRLARFVRALLGKCTEGLYVASSYLNSQGFEQDGLFAQYLAEQEVTAGA